MKIERVTGHVAAIALLTALISFSVTPRYSFSVEAESSPNEMKAKAVSLFAGKADSDGVKLPDNVTADGLIQDVKLYKAHWTSMESAQILIVATVEGKDRAEGLMNIWLAVADSDLKGLLTPILVLRGDFVQAMPLPSNPQHSSKVLLQENWMHQGHATHSIRVLEFEQDGAFKITKVAELNESQDSGLVVSVAVSKQSVEEGTVTEVHLWNRESQTFEPIREGQ